jgi:ferritin-like metal-binding protein YciE
MGVKPKGKSCLGMKGLIEEGQEIMSEDATEELMDAAIIGAAQRVEHYEIAAYGTARTFAERLGRDEIAGMLQETLDEEGEADHKLTEISENLLSSFSEGEGQEMEAESEDEEEEQPKRAAAPRRASKR